MYPSRLSVSDERRLRESNPQVTACMSVANPVGFNRRWRPFPHVGADVVSPARQAGSVVTGKQKKTVVSESSCAIRVHRGEREPRIPYGRHSETRRGIGRSGVGLVWLPAEDSNLEQAAPKADVLPVAPAGNMGVLTVVNDERIEERSSRPSSFPHMMARS